MRFCKYGSQLRTWEFAHRDGVKAAKDVELKTTHAGAAEFFTKQLRMHMHHCPGCAEAYDAWVETRRLMAVS